MCVDMVVNEAATSGGIADDDRMFSRVVCMRPAPKKTVQIHSGAGRRIRDDSIAITTFEDIFDGFAGDQC